MSRASLALAMVSLLTCACAASPGARIEAKVEHFQHEQDQTRLVARGQAFAAVGDTVRAQEYLAAALEAGADERALTPELITLCVRDGRYRLAVEHAQRYLTRHPRDRRMRFVLGSLYAALGETAEAERELRRVVDADRDSANANANYALAVVLRDQKQAPLEADRYFRAYLRLSPQGEHVEEARASLLESMP